VGQTHPVCSVIYFETKEDKIKEILTNHKVEFSQETVDKIKRNSLQLEEFLKPQEYFGHKMAD
jgi:hypothetical protein